MADAALNLDPASLNWFALAVMPRHEKAVAKILGNKGYETFLPIYSRRHKYSGRSRSFDLPLFPGYVFSRFDPSVRLPILTTPGVLQVMGTGRTPEPVPDSQIDAIRLAVQAGISLMPTAFWKTGDRARITSGPLTGVEGIVENIKPLRLVLSVALLQRSVLLEVDAECVRIA